LFAAMLAAMPASASADTPEAYTGSASAWALNAKVLSALDLKAGASHVTGDSTPKSHADGAGLSGLAGIGAQSVSNADALTANASSAPGEQCLLKVPVQGVLTLSAACSTSAAATTAMGPNASSTASVVSLNVSLINTILTLLKPILDPLMPVLDKTIGAVTGQLQPVLGGLLSSLNLTSLGLDLNSPVSSLVSTLEKLTTLATVSVLPSVSTVTSTAGAITASAVAKGAEIVVLPGLGSTIGAALLKVDVLAAAASATFNRGLGTSSAAIDPSIVTVSLLGGAPMKVQLGQPITLLAGTPLESTISLGAGTISNNADGSVGAVADGLSIHLLKGISGGINLDLAHAEAAVGGAKATTTPPTTPTPPTAAPAVNTGKLLLATTGTDLPLLPIGFVLILAGYLTRRRLARR